MITNNIFKQLTGTIAGLTLLTIVSEAPAHAARFNFDFPLIDDFENILGTGSVSFEAEPNPLTEWEKVALSEFEANLTLNDSQSFSFTAIEQANAVFFDGEFLGVEYRGESQESSEYVLLIDGGDELIKPGEPGAWSLWGPNAETGVVDTRIIGGDDVNYKTVPEPSSLVGLGILAMTLLAAQKKNKSQSNIKF
ncbi:MAG: PEP-CTERM sorting domain-containing protein [Limnoraphis sp. WC205]|jgi:hypothetical protein|nr:PEP-CTERM sorting domain-containing protein [Limnoraphis sp. WC205]